HLDVRPMRLAAAIEAAIEAMRPAASAKNIRVETRLDPRIDLIQGDPDRLQQVVWNLLSNAIKFTPEGGRVDLVLERVDSHFELTVRDTGKVLEAVLREAGAEVRACQSAAEALAELDTWWPDVLLSDIGMPGEDGYSLIRRVRVQEARHGRAIAAVALTAYARAEDRRK